MSGRQRRLEERRRRAGKGHAMVDIGEGMQLASSDAVLRALTTVPDDLDWRAAASNVVPILPRRRPMPPGAGEPFRVTLPPGIPTGFGIDIGPAFLMVGRALVHSWSVGAAAVVATAFDNLRDRTATVGPRDLVRQQVDGNPTHVLQSGLGCASTLILVPDELSRIFGPGPQCFIAPMRDLLISLPVDVDRTFLAWLNEEFASMDPNGLALDAFVFERGGVRYEPFRRAAVG